ncbi:MAG: hypothetical protein WA902_08195 [Thermosynechococcaceae cyanobacterium]
MTDERADYDSPWKQAIENYFSDFLVFFFPDIHADIDWEKGYEFLDQELQKIVREAELGKRFADKLVKVWKQGGQESLILLHIEVQGQPDANFAGRMERYNYRIEDRYDLPVVSLAVLADERKSWRPNEYRFEQWGFSRVVQFPIAKLLDYEKQWQSMEDSSNPFATVVMAHLKAQETKKNQSLRKEWKLRLTRRLYEKGYERQDVLNLFLFIDWLISLPEDLQTSFRQDLEHYEKEKQMPYVTSIERMAKKEGLIEGLLEGIKLGLEIKFGNEGLKLLPELLQIKELETIRAIQSGLREATMLSEVRSIYASDKDLA